MRTSSAIAFSLIAATAAPAFAAPLAVRDIRSIEARGYTQTAAEMFEAAGTKILGLSSTQLDDVVWKVGAGHADTVSASKLSAAWKAVAKTGTAAQKESLLKAMSNSVSRVEAGAANAGDIVLLKVLSKGKETGVAAKAALAVLNSPEAIAATAAKVKAGQFTKITEPAMDAFVRSAAKNGDDAVLAGLKKTALENFSKTGSKSSSQDIQILKSLGRTGDKDAKAAFATMTKEIQKEMGVISIVNPAMSPGKFAAVSVGLGGGGLVAGSLLYKMAHTPADPVSVGDLPATVPDGAIDEATQKQILAALVANPDEYEAAMAEIRAVPGITPAEIELFESMDPAKEMTTEAVAVAPEENLKRSLADLD